MRFWSRQEEVKSQIGYQDEASFILGYMSGMIVTSFRANFKSVFNNSPTLQQQIDITPIVVNRMNEIRDKIFRTGD